MKCKSCMKTIPQNSSYCIHCGSKQSNYSEFNKDLSKPSIINMDSPSKKLSNGPDISSQRSIVDEEPKSGPKWLLSLFLGLVLGFISITPKLGNLVEASERVQSGEWQVLALRATSQDITAHFITNSIIWFIVILIVTSAYNKKKKKTA